MSYAKLREHFSRINDFQHVSAIVGWDEAVNMPPAAGSARAQALTTLHTLMHEQLTSAQVGEWIAVAQDEALSDPWDKANLKHMRRRYIRANALPAELVTAFTRARIESEQAWRRLRAENDWAAFVPHLQSIVGFVKEMAQIQGQALGLAPYDALLDEYCYGFTQETIDALFAPLQDFLPDFLQTVLQKQQAIEFADLPGPFPIAQQRELGLQLMQTIGFDFAHGRLDVSHHPFCGGVPSDVRITTRYDENDFTSAIMGVCHETGHALYEQGLPQTWGDQPVGEAVWSIHESQSLLIEMQACRSPEFITYLTPLVQEYFPQLSHIKALQLQQLYKKVQPGYIRVDADEVTYPLHVMLRYGIERDLFVDKIQVADLPDVWHEHMHAALGLSTKGNYKDGVMQDVHWPAGAFGYFPSYTLGALIAAQFYQAALTAEPSIPAQLQRGDFTPLVAWLRQHIHSKGSSLEPLALIEAASGAPLSAQAFIQHVQRRYA